jgi:hypothetical protein
MTKLLHPFVVTASRPLGPVLAICMLLSGCVTGAREAIFEPGGALAARSYQTRTLETGDANAAMRAVISTLQDLGFVIDRADAALGSVSATKLERYQVRITVTVRPGAAGRLLVRATADYSEPQLGRTAVAIDDPLAYQDFFQALDRSVFFAAQKTE